MGNKASPPPAGGLESARSEQARSGRVIVNPISGERIVIRQSGAETGGKLLSFDLFLPPGGHVPAGHVHPVQEERFTVISGLMRFRLGRQTILARPGETVLIPAGKAHWFGAAGAQVAHARVEVRPALRMEEFFAENETLSLAGRLGGTRLPRLSDLARILLEFQREVAVPYAPAFLVRALLAPLAWLGRRRARAADAGHSGSSSGG
jgi:quercetin dioxygenase-like cupin family protein